jgi:polyhydroxybutyrate depolymerase
MRAALVCAALVCAALVFAACEGDPDGGGGDADLSASAPDDGGVDRTRVPSTLGGFPTEGSTGCGQTGAPTGTLGLALTVDGVPRTAVAYVPESYDPRRAYPVVFVFHGNGANGSLIRVAFNLEPAADGKAIFAYPDGAGGTWDVTLHAPNVDMDLVFAVRETLRAQYCVDVRRTFATGYSAGAFFVNQLACRYGADELTAIAPHSGNIDPQDDRSHVYGPPNPDGGPFMERGKYDFYCPSDVTTAPPPPRPKLPPAAMIIHGQCDEAPGVGYAQGRRTAEHWAFAARCATTPSVATNSTPACPESTACPATTADPCYRTPGCSRDIVFCAIPGMGHPLWCDAPARIWSFFAAQ